jgi:flagellar basal body-associated protein FliL
LAKNDKQAEAPEANANAVDDPAIVAKKAKKKQLLILIAAVSGSLAIGGGAVAAFFIYSKNNAPAASEAKLDAPLKKNEKAEKPPANAMVYVSLPRLSAPLIDHDKVLGYAILDLSLEVENSAIQAKVFEQLPVLRAAFLQEVTDHPIGKKDDPTIVDYDNLTKRLADVANRELKDAHVNRVMITQTIRL